MLILRDGGKIEENNLSLFFTMCIVQIARLISSLLCDDTYVWLFFVECAHTLCNPQAHFCSATKKDKASGGLVFCEPPDWLCSRNLDHIHRTWALFWSGYIDVPYSDMPWSTYIHISCKRAFLLSNYSSNLMVAHKNWRFMINNSHTSPLKYYTCCVWLQ